MTGESFSPRAREGFSLVEAMVAVLLLTLIVTTLGTHLFHVSRRGIDVAIDGHRQALVARELDRLAALPFHLLEDASWKNENSVWIMHEDPPFPHRRKIVVDQSADGRALELRLIIEQETPIQRVDTILFVRPRPAGGNPFGTQ